jgi:hypothetical protein
MEKIARLSLGGFIYVFPLGRTCVGSMKKTAIMFFVFFVFVCCKNVIAENISSEELMKCLLSEDAQQIKSCLAQKFPNFVKSRFEPYDAITIASCHSSEIEHQEYCTKAKEYLSKELNDLLNVWALLSQQCSQSMNPENCISQIDISSVVSLTLLYIWQSLT